MSSNTCQVCEGPAEGNHFGVPACKACSAYFRRSLAEDKVYKCKHSGQCEIVLNKRNQCRACRLKKCFAVGMRKEYEDCTVTPPSEVASSPPLPEFFLKLKSAYTHFFESQKSFFKLQNFPAFSTLMNQQDEFKMMTMEEHNKMEKINASLILSLLNDSFLCFTQFTREEKRDFFGPFAVRFINLHRCFLTAKYFPNEERKVAFHYGYYCSNDLDGIKHFYGDIPEVESLYENISPAVNLLRKTANKMVELDVTNEELGGLIALMYYSQLEQYPTMCTDIRKRTEAITVSEFHGKIIEKYGVHDGGLRYTRILSLILDFENICTAFTHSLIIGNMYLKKGQEVFMLLKDSFLDS